MVPPTSASAATTVNARIPDSHRRFPHHLFPRYPDGLSGSGPAASLTVHQVYFAGLAGSANPTVTGAATGPALRTDISQHARIRSISPISCGLEYGSNFDSVGFFAAAESFESLCTRATFDLGTKGSVRVACSSEPGTDQDY